MDRELLHVGDDSGNGTIRRLFLSDFFVPAKSERTVTLPLLVANGTVFNNGERLSFMPRILDELHIDGSLLPQENFNMQSGFGFPLTYAITGSSAFPGVLPMLKLHIAGSDQVLRVEDGGIVDNLGYMTLMELLAADATPASSKKAIIIDCSGSGNHSQFQRNDKVDFAKLLYKTLFYSLTVNEIDAEKNIAILSAYYGMRKDQVVTIGFQTIRNRLYAMESTVTPQEKEIVSAWRSRMLSGDEKWDELYLELCRMPGFADQNPDNFMEMPVGRFRSFTYPEIFALFELSAQVKTKLRIEPYEKHILVLAGRYAAWLEREALQGI